MSATAYLATPAGASPFTGTAAHTVFQSAPAAFTDGDVADVLQVRHTGSLLWGTPGEMIEAVARFRANGTTIHTMQFGAIGGDDDPRDVTLEWWVTLTAGDTCRVEGDGVISGAGGQGPNKADRNPITRAQTFVLPVTFDITIQLDDAGATYTPDSSFLHKVEPTLSADAGTANVVSVNGETGTVVLDAGDVGALDTSLLAMPVLVYERDTPGFYPARPGDPDDPALYVGVPEPTDLNCTDPSFSPNVDFWWPA